MTLLGLSPFFLLYVFIAVAFPAVGEPCGFLSSRRSYLFLIPLSIFSLSSLSISIFISNLLFRISGKCTTERNVENATEFSARSSRSANAETRSLTTESIMAVVRQGRRCRRIGSTARPRRRWRRHVCVHARATSRETRGRRDGERERNGTRATAMRCWNGNEILTWRGGSNGANGVVAVRAGVGKGDCDY